MMIKMHFYAMYVSYKHDMVCLAPDCLVDVSIYRGEAQ